MYHKVFVGGQASPEPNGSSHCSPRRLAEFMGWGFKGEESEGEGKDTPVF